MLKNIYRYTLLFLIVICSLALKPEDLGEPWSEIAKLVNARNYIGAVDKLLNYAKSTSDVEQLAEIYYRVGFIYHEYIHDYDRALDAYQKVVSLRGSAKSAPDLEPFVALSQMSIGGIYRRVGRYDDAIKIYCEVAADYSGTEFATVALKDIEGVQSALAEIQFQQRIIDKYPSTEFAAEAQFRIAELYLSVQNLNNPQRAIQEYSGLVSQYPNSRRAAEAQLKIGNIYWTLLHKPEEAISAYQKLMQGQFAVSNLGAESLFQIGKIYCNELRDHRKALNSFSRFLKDYPTYWKYPAAVYWQAMCYEQLMDYEDAIETYEMFIQLYPDEEPGWLADIGRLGEKNVKERVRPKIEDLKKLAPGAYWNRAERLRSLKKYHEALTAYMKLMSKYPGSEYAEKAKTQVKNVKGLAEIQICQDAIRRKKTEAPASQYRIAEIYEIEIQDFSRAIDEYEKAAANYPGTYWAAEALYRIGLIYSGLNSSDINPAGKETKKGIKPDYRKAIEKYRLLVREYPNTYTAIKAHHQMGYIYRNYLNDYTRALEAYGKVMSDYPKQNH